MTKIGQFATIITTPCLDREIVIRGHYSLHGDEKHVRVVLRQEIERYISEVEASGLHVANIRPLPLSKDELLKRDRKEFDLPTVTSGGRTLHLHSIRGHHWVAVADRSVYYEGGCSIYYSATVTLAEGPKPMCDMCGTGTGPCKEEPTSNVAVEAILGEMRLLSGAMKELEKDMLACVRRLAELE